MTNMLLSILVFEVILMNFMLIFRLEEIINLLQSM